MRRRNIIISIILLLILATGTAVTANIGKDDNDWYVKLGKIVSENKVGVASIDTWSPINSDFDYERHDQFILTLVEYLGMEKEEAVKEAVDVQITNVALLQKAIDLGIKVSKEDALQEAKIDRKIIEEGSANNAEEAFENIKSFVKGLGITEDQYWNEYVVPQYQEKLMLLELQNQVLSAKASILNENVIKEWESFEKEVVEDFVNNNMKKVEQFKNYAK